MKSILGVLLMVGLTSCATQPLPPLQTIDVVVTKHNRLWSGKLYCQAENTLGNSPFIAPGKVTVSVSSSPLQIHCKAAPVAEMNTATSTVIVDNEKISATQPDGAKQSGSEALAKVIEPAATHATGPVVASQTMPGSSDPGLEISTVVDSLTSRHIQHYPTQIVLQIAPAVTR
jgi:hypothetical protein